MKAINESKVNLISYMIKDVCSVLENCMIEEDYVQLKESMVKDESTFSDFEGFYYKENDDFGYIFFKYRENDVYVPSYGIYAEGNDTDKVIYELYKHVSNIWVDKGVKKHVIDILNLDKYKTALLGLGFSYEQVYGILDLNTYKLTSDDISVRGLNSGDKELLRRMADIIYSYQHEAPVFVVADEKNVSSIRKGYQGLLEDKEVLFYIAEEETPVSFAGLWTNDYGYLHPKDSIELTVVGTFIEMASKGAGTKLINYVMNDLIKRGFKIVTTDWRITNIKSRRFWGRKCGFKETKYRMIRHIEPNYEKFIF